MPGARLRNEVRYLRQLGIPHTEQDVGEGRGHRLYYRYEDLIELGVAIYAIRHGVKPRDVAIALTRERVAHRRLFRDALKEQPEAALKAEWVKSRGQQIPILANDVHLRIHDRHASPAGHFQMVAPDQAGGPQEVFGAREVFRDGEARILVPVSRIAIELTAWALEAPAIRPGPRTALTLIGTSRRDRRQ
jgi:hypothetical protein